MNGIFISRIIFLKTKRGDYSLFIVGIYTEGKFMAESAYLEIQHRQINILMQISSQFFSLQLLFDKNSRIVFAGKFEKLDEKSPIRISYK